MKFFTREFQDGDLSDAAMQAAELGYQKHLSRLVLRMPPGVRGLALGVNIHDALIQEVVFARADRKLKIKLRCGDLQVGYCDLTLAYSIVVLEDDDIATLRELSRNRGSEALYHEVDLANDESWAHRMLFWPPCEVEVRFRSIAVCVEPATSREFVRQDDVYVELPLQETQTPRPGSR